MLRGGWQVCSRCSGTGEARYNHMNGDTHCYLCLGEGLVYRPSAEERAQDEGDRQWFTDVHFRLVGGSSSLQCQLRRPVREATTATPYMAPDARAAMGADEAAAYEASRAADREAGYQLERRLTWWCDEGMRAVQQERGDERRAHEAASLRAAKADPRMQARLAAAAARRAARNTPEAVMAALAAA